MKTLDDYKGDPFYNRDVAFLAEDSHYNKRFAARALKAEEEAFKSDMEAWNAEGALGRMHEEVEEALCKGSFRGIPLRDAEFGYPAVDPIKWTNITLRRYTAKERPEHHGAELYHIQMLINPREMELLSGKQIRRVVADKFTSAFHAHIEKLLKHKGRGGHPNPYEY